MDGNKTKSEIIVSLFELDTVKFGNFILKSKTTSPVYIDFRGIISSPDLMRRVCELLWRASSELDFKAVCGVPYTALPFATLISANHDKPMLIRRKEAKSYGTKKLVEGHVEPGDRCLVIEDVVTTGSSVVETVEALRSVGAVVDDAVVLLDRGQGGRDILLKAGIHLHSVFTMSELLNTLQKAGKIDEGVVKTVTDFIEQNQLHTTVTNDPNTLQVMSYADRAGQCRHQLARQIFTIMDQKKTNLAFAADVTTCRELLDLAERVGPYICVLKTHADILADFSIDAMKTLRSLADKHQFLIFEDRKFADIGQTVSAQYCGGLLSVSDWSDFVTVHSLPGPGVISALRQAVAGKGCVIVAQMSSDGCLADDSYTQRSVALAEDNRDFVLGFVCQSRVSSDQSFIHFTPGVNMAERGDSLGQQYHSPHDVVFTHRTDVIIVGRGIRAAVDPAAAAKQYRDAGYQAYLDLLQSS